MQPISTILSKNPGYHRSDLSKKTNGAFFNRLIQPKLTINQPNDIYEQEADVVADRVMRMTDKAPNPLFFPPTPLSSIQRKCADCEEEEKVQMKGEAIASAGMTVPSSVNKAINSGGHPLDRSTKDFMEHRFGYDFANVQIHNDPLANQSSQEINALAYTQGNHVIFAPGQYQPDTNAGKRLLAHELTHVIQQNNQAVHNIYRAPDDGGDKFKRKPPGKGAFTEADYNDWVKRHPKFSFHNGGAHEPDAFYNRYTPQWFWKNGYFYAFSRYAGFKGGYIEVWLSNKDNGHEFNVFRGDMAPSVGRKNKSNVATRKNYD
jgi:hypothetical protein